MVDLTVEKTNEILSSVFDKGITDLHLTFFNEQYYLHQLENNTYGKSELVTRDDVTTFFQGVKTLFKLDDTKTTIHDSKYIFKHNDADKVVLGFFLPIQGGHRIELRILS
ncbi:MAG: hypothetical protein ACPGJV_04940 [Bacteriovoracaceae bacterium]